MGIAKWFDERKGLGFIVDPPVKISLLGDRDGEVQKAEGGRGHGAGAAPPQADIQPVAVWRDRSSKTLRPSSCVIAHHCRVLPKRNRPYNPLPGGPTQLFRKSLLRFCACHVAIIAGSSTQEPAGSGGIVCKAPLTMPSLSADGSPLQERSTIFHGPLSPAAFRRWDQLATPRQRA
jgi:hypothetical protein